MSNGAQNTLQQCTVPAGHRDLRDDTVAPTPLITEDTYTSLLKGVARGAMAASRWLESSGDDRIAQCRAHAYQIVRQLGIPPGNAVGIIAEWSHCRCAPGLPLDVIQDAVDAVVHGGDTPDDAFVDPTAQGSRALPVPMSKYGFSSDVRWVWEGYFACGYITLLSGATTIGKTTLLGWLFKYMAESLESGQPNDALGALVNGGRVLVITEEDGVIWKRRADTLGGLPDTVEFLHNASVFSAGRPTLTEWRDFCTWVAALVPLRDYSLVLIDPWQTFNPSADENDSLGNVEALSHLRAITEEGAAVVISHHTHKSAHDYITAHRGSSSLPGLADIVLWLRTPARSRTGKSIRRILVGSGRLGGTPPELVLELTAERGYRAVVEVQAEERASRRDEKRQSRMDVIAGILGAGGAPLTLAEVLDGWSERISGDGAAKVKAPSKKTLYGDLAVHEGVVSYDTSPRTYELREAPASDTEVSASDANSCVMSPKTKSKKRRNRAPNASVQQTALAVPGRGIATSAT